MTLRTTQEQNAMIVHPRYNFSTSGNVRFLFIVTIFFTVFIMACVISIIAWMVGRINKIIALRDEELHRLNALAQKADLKGSFSSK